MMDVEPTTTASASPAIQIEGLRHTYKGGHTALDGVNLAFGTGLFGLLEPNGAGKSTLMRIVCTLLDPTEGRVRATLFRSEVAGAMGVAAVLGFDMLISGFGQNPVRISPFWNPAAIDNADAAELLAWSLQNRIGILLAMAAILGLAFMRANRRERMLGA